MSQLEREIKNRVFPIILKTIKESAQRLIEEKKPIIVGVTGSVGKSSFIYLLDAVMKDTLKTKTTFKGNSETGIPLEILGIRDYLQSYSLANWLLILALTPFAYLIGKITFDYDLLIAEMGIDSSKRPKNMTYLLEIFKPNVGVFLAVSAVHSQQFAEELGLDGTHEAEITEAIAREKGKLVTELPPTAHAVINIDSPFIKKLLPHIDAKLTTFGKDAEADFRLLSHEIHSRSTEYIFMYRSKEYDFEIKDYLLSQEYGYTILAVIASSVLLGADIDSVLSKIQERFSIPPGRMSLIEGKNGTLILDSSYNSSPIALRAVLEAVSNFPSKGRKVLILGDMRELGPLAEQEHSSLADLVSKVGDEVILIGPLMAQFLAPELAKRNSKFSSFLTALGVGDYLISNNLVQEGDVVVVKGSQNTIYLEQVVKELMLNPEKAHDLLCRQSRYWDDVRARFFTQRK